MSQRKTKLFILLTLLLFIAAGAVWYFDQGPVVWERSFEHNKGSRINFVQATPDGGVVIGGSYFCISNKPDYGLDYSDGYPWAIKLDSAGNLLWRVEFINLMGFSGDSAALLADGSLAIGCTKQAGLYKHRIALVTVLDAQGKHQEKGYYVAEPGYSISLARTLANGGIMLLGAKEQPGKKTPNAWVARLSPKLGLEWSKTFDGAKYGSFEYLYSAPRGSSIVCAVKKPGKGIREYWWLKISQKGSLSWDQVVKQNKYWRPEIGQKGSQAWEQVLKQTEARHTTFVPFYGTKILADGGLLVSGRYDDQKNYTKVGFILLRMNGNNGEIEWAKLYLREGRDEINTTNPLTAGLMFYGGGYEPVYPTASSGIVLWIGDAKGNIYWEKRYSADKDSYDFIARSTVTHDGGIVVVGRRHDKLWVAKIAPTEGWLKSLLKNTPEISYFPVSM